MSNTDLCSSPRPARAAPWAQRALRASAAAAIVCSVMPASIAAASMTSITVGQTIAPVPVVDAGTVLAGYDQIAFHGSLFFDGAIEALHYQGLVYRNQVDQSLAFEHRFNRAFGNPFGLGLTLPQYNFDGIVYDILVGAAPPLTGVGTAATYVERHVSGLFYQFDTWLQGTHSRMLVVTNASDYHIQSTSTYSPGTPFGDIFAIGTVVAPSGPVIPSPGAAAILGLGGLVAMRRRR